MLRPRRSQAPAAPGGGGTGAGGGRAASAARPRRRRRRVPLGGPPEGNDRSRQKKSVLGPNAECGNGGSPEVEQLEAMWIPPLV